MSHCWYVVIVTVRLAAGLTRVVMLSLCTEHAQQSHGALDDRKTLGPIGTERAARRPANVAASLYPTELNMAAVGGGAGPVPDTWNMYSDGKFCLVCCWLRLVDV